MAITNSIYKDLSAMSGGRFLLSGGFRPNGASGIVAGSVKGGGYTVARTSAGLYTVTLDEYPGVDLESVFVQAHSEAGTGHVHAAAKELVMDSSTDKAFQIEVYRGSQGATGTIQIPIDGGQEVDGTALADFADGDAETPGLAGGAENGGIRWNNKGTLNPVVNSFLWPQDLDVLVAPTVYCAISKTGATDNAGNTTSMSVLIANHPDAVLHDADTLYGGNTTAVLDPASTANTVTVVNKALTITDLPTPPCAATILLQPTDGTLDTDDAILHAAWITYSRKMELVDLASDADNQVSFMAILRNTTGMV